MAQIKYDPRKKDGDDNLPVTITLDDENVTNDNIEKPRLTCYEETISVADFTDGGSAAGTLDLDTSIPKGAVFVKTLITDITGFAGDTSAVITIGDGSDVDRYNTGTPDVFATSDTEDAGAVSGTAYHDDAKTPKVTVTTNSDFTSCKTDGNGKATIALYYYQP